MHAAPPRWPEGLARTIPFHFCRCSIRAYPGQKSVAVSRGSGSRFTITSSPSTRTANTSTRSCTGYSDSPVFKLNVHECHGQTTASPSSHPCPIGPCRCGQILSIADSVPFTLAKQIPTPATSASATFPTAGASPTPHNLTHCATRKPSNLHLRASLKRHLERSEVERLLYFALVIQPLDVCHSERSEEPPHFAFAVAVACSPRHYPPTEC